jgi:hypothetical protein
MALRELMNFKFLVTELDAWLQEYIHVELEATDPVIKLGARRKVGRLDQALQLIHDMDTSEAWVHHQEQH